MSTPTRDLRDPQRLGESLRSFCRLHSEIKPSFVYDRYADELTQHVPNYAANPSCIDKYGSPLDVQEKWERIQIV